MTLRLVLVSLVAALGLTIPGTPMIEGWVASSQHWMNAKFADWDTRNPPTADYVIVSDYYDAAGFASRSDTTVPNSNVTSETVAAHEVRPNPSPVSVGPNDEIARRNAHFSPLRRVAFTSNRIDFRPIDITVGWHRGIALELNRRHEGIGLAVPSKLSFAVVRPRFKPLAIAEPFRTLADELNRQNEGIGLAPPEPSAPKVAASPRFEPIAVPDQLEVGIAHELNRCSDGLGFIPISSSVFSKGASSVSRTDSQPPASSFSSLEREPSLYFAGEVVATTESSGIELPVVSLAAVSRDSSAAPSVATSPATVSPTSTPLPPVSVVVKEAGGSLEDLDIEVAGELVPTEDGFGLLAQRSPRAASRDEVACRRQTFDPLVAEDVYNLVDELNRQNDGLDLNGAAPTSTAPKVANSSPPSRSLSRAVQLTRDAVYAWVNVLSGPALVTVTSSR